MGDGGKIKHGWGPGKDAGIRRRAAGECEDGGQGMGRSRRKSESEVRKHGVGEVDRKITNEVEEGRCRAKDGGRRANLAESGAKAGRGRR